jgi:hypothetical protein
MVEYIMKKEVCGTFHAKCGTRDLTKVFGTISQKAGRVVTLGERRYNFYSYLTSTLDGGEWSASRRYFG